MCALLFTFLINPSGDDKISDFIDPTVGKSYATAALKKKGFMYRINRDIFFLTFTCIDNTRRKWVFQS